MAINHNWVSSIHHQEDQGAHDKKQNKEAHD